jgi:hypothetical protein
VRKEMVKRGKDGKWRKREREMERASDSENGEQFHLV